MMASLRFGAVLASAIALAVACSDAGGTVTNASSTSSSGGDGQGGQATGGQGGGGHAASGGTGGGNSEPVDLGYADFPATIGTLSVTVRTAELALAKR